MNVLKGMTTWCGLLDDEARRRGRTAALGAVTTVALAATLAGCSPGGAEPDSGAAVSPAVSESPSASAGPEGQESSEPEDPQAIIEQRTADAIERYKEYVQIKNDTARRGESSLAELEKGGYIGSHGTREYEKEYGADLEKFKRKQTGEFVVDSVDSVKYDGDPLKEFLGHEVELRVCVDSGGIGMVDDSGNEVPDSFPDRFTADVTMRGIRWTELGDERAVWAVAFDGNVEKGC